ncbi:MAG: TIGR04282 family arsenosugar biosynthesis glycosyltransferase [Ginsengibacter sp.]
MTKNALLIFVKNPQLGFVKTRLARTVGNEKALAIYKELLSHTVLITRSLPIEKSVFYSDYIEDDLWESSLFQKNIQDGDNLGVRMRNAFKISFAAGYAKVVIIGTDCFELTSEIIMQAFAVLEYNDIVIGPATDGGYYLLGMKKEFSPLFKNISWSTPEVLNQTIEICRNHSLFWFLLPELSDIDDEEDLKKHESQLPLNQKKQ